MAKLFLRTVTVSVAGVLPQIAHKRFFNVDIWLTPLIYGYSSNENVILTLFHSLKCLHGLLVFTSMFLKR